MLPTEFDFFLHECDFDSIYSGLSLSFIILLVVVFFVRRRTEGPFAADPKRDEPYQQSVYLVFRVAPVFSYTDGKALLPHPLSLYY